MAWSSDLHSYFGKLRSHANRDVAPVVRPTLSKMSAAAEIPCRFNVSDPSPHPWFSSAPLWFAQLDARGNLTALNPALRRVLDQSIETKFPRLTDLIDPDLKADCERLIQEMFEGKRQSFQFESSSRLSSVRFVRWTVWRVSVWSKDPYALILAEEVAQEFKDGTENEDRLRQTMRLEAVGRLAAGIVHDFNNVLTGVLLYCDLLLASLQGHESRKYAEEIRTAAIQAAGVVRQLLNVARPGSSEPRLLSLNEVIESLIGLLSRLIGQNIRLNLCLNPKLGLIRFDCTQAQQILLNLVLNARDAMPNGGRIDVETSNCSIQIVGEDSSLYWGNRRLPCVLLAVADDGSGMDTATRSHLFKPFFTTKGSKGTGLGLAGVYDIVTANGGLIHVDTAPGSGTRVTVLLPLAGESGANLDNTQPEAREDNRELLPLTEEA